MSIASIIGTDDRFPILDTTDYHWSAITFITSSLGNWTGWLMDDDTVATAGHFVHTGPGDIGWASNVRVYPGRNGSYLPYGSCGWRTLYTVNGWASNGNEEYDYGAIKLDCTVGNQAGWFGFLYVSGSLDGTTSYVEGYPGDKDYATMWGSTDQFRATYVRQLFYANDTVVGQSGSAAWTTRGNLCTRCVMAIHTRGLHGSTRPHNTLNHGTRITESVYNNLVAWKND